MKKLTHRLFAVLIISLLWVVGCQSKAPIPAPTKDNLIPQVTNSTLPTPVNDSLTPQVTNTVEKTAGKIAGPLFVDPDNRRYFTDGIKVNGKYKAIYLTGSHTWCNFMDCGNTNPPPVFDYEKYLDFLAARHYNFFRLWRAENARGGEAGPDFWFTPMPYLRSTECCAFDGGNKFDLEKFNQNYFDRMRERIIKAGDRGIYVSVMLFDGWSVESKIGGHNPWIGHPYRLENNINGINGDVNGNGQGEETHILTGTQVTALQEAYVRKVIDTINDLDNVLYEISNESPGDDPATPKADGSKDWQYHMINMIRDYEAAKPKQHPVGMTWEWLNGNNQFLYDSPADWISLGGNVDLKTYEPAATDGSLHSKVILADTDHLCGICGSAQWVWKSFTRGENPIFMDIYDSATSGRGMPLENPNEEEIRSNLSYTSDFAAIMNLVEMSPQPALCSTGYCLANPAVVGAEYLVFLPAGEHLLSTFKQLGINKFPLVYLPSDGRVLVDLTASPATLAVEWFNPANGKKIQGKDVTGGSPRSFTAPFSGDAVLYIYAKTP